MTVRNSTLCVQILSNIKNVPQTKERTNDRSIEKTDRYWTEKRMKNKIVEIITKIKQRATQTENYYSMY